MVATEVSLLVHTPPAVVSANVAEVPGQSVVVPVIAPIVGGAVTVTKAVAIDSPQELDIT